LADRFGLSLRQADIGHTFNNRLLIPLLCQLLKVVSSTRVRQRGCRLKIEVLELALDFIADGEFERELSLPVLERGDPEANLGRLLQRGATLERSLLAFCQLALGCPLPDRSIRHVFPIVLKLLANVALSDESFRRVNLGGHI